MAAPAELNRIEAPYTPRPVVIDGRLDDPIWTQGPANAFV
jgi:hypothetical protein